MLLIDSISSGLICSSVGLEIPKIEVRFENLEITAKVQVGSRALPTLVNYTRDTLEVRSFSLFDLQN